MSGLAEGWETALLERIAGKSPVATRYVALCTTAPTKAAAGTAATFTGYKRAAIESTGWNAAVGGGAEASSISNSAEVTFECTGGESTVTHFEIWSAATGGERIAWGALTASKTINSTSTPAKFAAGELKVTLS